MEPEAAYETSPPRIHRGRVLIVLLLSALPAILHWVHLDLSEMPGLEPSGPNRVVVHALAEWSASLLALAVGSLAWVHYMIRRDTVAPILALALVASSLMDGTHALAAADLILRHAPNAELCPWGWVASRTANLLVSIAGVLVALRAARPPGRASMVIVGLLVSAAAVGGALLLGLQEHLPAAIDPAALVPRPLDLLPLALLLPASYALWRLFRATGSVFAEALLLSMIPTGVAQLHMSFGSRALFDAHFVAAHAVKVLVYAVPLLGICADYLHGYRREQQALARARASGVARDRALEELRRSEERLRHIFDSAHDASFVIDPAKRLIIDANEGAAGLLGYARAELQGMPLARVHPQDEEELLALAEETEPARSATAELSCRTRAGGTVPVEVSAASFVHEGRRLVLAQARDIRARLRLERELRQAQKLEAIGRLAGSVAHDFNNMLTVLQGNCALLQEHADSTDALRADRTLAEGLAAISDASERAARLTRQLLTLSRKGDFAVEVLDLNEVVAGMQRMLQRLLGPHIELSIELWHEAVTVRADRGRIEQVILNLGVNARDAMEEGGRLQISTSIVSEGRPWALLTVRDNGAGMSREVLDRAFDPFFTTKGKDRGTGIGLATVRAVAEQCGGAVHAESAPGAGTSFVFKLPYHAVPLGTRTPTPSPARAVRVLVVEDREEVRSLARRCLERAGYHVEEARDGAEGLAAFRAKADRFDLVVSDSVMPRMHGQDMAEAIWKIDPKMPVLFMTGYSVTSLKELGPGPSSVLRKPFSPEALTQAAAALLDGPI